MRSLNQFKKIIFVCVITAAAMFFAVPATQTAYADTQAPVKYVDENGTEHQVNSYTVLKNDMTEIGSAEGTWYVVNENVTFEKNLKVKDNAKANLILCEGKKMRCKDNFTVNETSELTIWGQKQTSGELESSGGYFSAYAAIGGAPDHSNGLIEIHSGNVIAHLGGAIFFNRGAAIGAGNGADGGEIRILGGKVHAYTEGAGTIKVDQEKSKSAAAMSQAIVKLREPGSAAVTKQEIMQKVRSLSPEEKSMIRIRSLSCFRRRIMNGARRITPGWTITTGSWLNASASWNRPTSKRKSLRRAVR